VEEVEIGLVCRVGLCGSFGATAAGLVERDSGVNAEVWLGIDGYAEKICDG
jgi:hypothetical protein